MRLHHQLPAYSPLSFSALVRGLLALWPWGRDPRGDLTHLLWARFAAEEVALTDSGTTALRLALELMKARGHTPVALPGFSCYDVATAAVGARVPVVLYDVDPETLSPEPSSLEAALSAGARSAVIAPLYGFPVDWDSIHSLANHHGTTLIEDAAQALGSEFRGRPAGTQGDLTVLSFGRGKGWTGAGGGALMARTGDWHEGVREKAPLPGAGAMGEASHLAVAIAMWILGRPALYGLPRSIPALRLGETHYRESHAPGGIRRVAGAIALAAADASVSEVTKRRTVARRYRDFLDREASTGGDLLLPEPVARGISGYLRFPVLLSSDALKTGGVRERFARRLGAERSYPRPLDSLSPLQPFLASAIPTPGAARLAQEVLTLPTHSRVRQEERDGLLRTLLKVSAESRS